MYLRLAPDEKDHPVLPRLRVFTKRKERGQTERAFGRKGGGSMKVIQRRGSRGPPYGWTDGPSFCVLQHFSQVEYVSAVHGEGGRDSHPS